MDICQRNVDRNIDVDSEGTVLVRELKWQAPFVVFPGELFTQPDAQWHSSGLFTEDKSDYQWRPADRKKLEDVQYILAADGMCECIKLKSGIIHVSTFFDFCPKFSNLEYKDSNFGKKLKRE